MLCPFCGKDIDDGSTFCPECSTSFEPPEGMDENLPSQVLYNGDKNHVPEDSLIDESADGKKSSKVASLAVTISIVTAVVLAIIFLSKPIAEKIKQLINHNKPAATASAAIRKTLYEPESYTLEITINDKNSNEKKTIRIMVDYGETSEDTGFYYECGDEKLAIRDGLCYRAGKTIEAEKFFGFIDSEVYDATKEMSGGYGVQQINSKNIFDAIVAGKLSEEELEKAFNAYGNIIFAYFMGTDSSYILPEYDDVQVICAEFLNGKVSKNAFEITEKDGKYEFTINTETFLNELVEYVKGNEDLEEHCEKWGLEENADEVNKAIKYCGEEFPQITGTIELNGDGFVTKADVKVGDAYEVTVSFSDINSTEISKELCESLAAATVE